MKRVFLVWILILVMALCSCQTVKQNGSKSQEESFPEVPYESAAPEKEESFPEVPYESAAPEKEESFGGAAERLDGKTSASWEEIRQLPQNQLRDGNALFQIDSLSMLKEYAATLPELGELICSDAFFTQKAYLVAAIWTTTDTADYAIKDLRLEGGCLKCIYTVSYSESKGNAAVYLLAESVEKSILEKAESFQLVPFEPKK
ncbi:MAG: hypothetical protein IJP27_02395, partial [Clostridia bacterium]|nr:hypothetical protein [Clostridia bacterium]